MVWVAPESPPMVNMATNPKAKSMGVLSRRSPPQVVASQFRIMMPVGTEIKMVEAAKAVLATGPNPTANMWWAHTPQLMKPMATSEKRANALMKRDLAENNYKISVS